MQIDISFDFAKVYDIEKFDVVLGQKFSLQSDSTEKLKWFSDNDPVLSIKDSGTNADGEATALGESTILLMDENLVEQKRLTVRVVQAIVQQATELGISSGEDIPK
jgi:hypothetical protein